MRSYLSHAMCASCPGLLWHVHGGCQPDLEDYPTNQEPSEVFIHRHRYEWANTSTRVCSTSSPKSTWAYAVTADNPRACQHELDTTLHLFALSRFAVRRAFKTSICGQRGSSCIIPTTSNLSTTAATTSRPQGFVNPRSRRSRCGLYGESTVTTRETGNVSTDVDRFFCPRTCYWPLSTCGWSFSL
jgi:hypothetical protein